MFDLIGNADKALYLAKVTGKNQTTTFDKTKAVRNATARR
jgi:PleD family two-component response regulator